MAAAVPAARFSALEAELAAKASRISELEARVSCLEAENARLRKALAEGEGAGRAAEGGDPVEEGLRGRKRGAVETVGGGVAGGDVVVLSDGEEGIAVDASKGGSREEGVVAVPTPRKHAARVVIRESEDEEDAQGVQGGNSGSSKGNASCDSNVRLEDDDVSTTARGKKRAAARVVTSDSEDEDLSPHRRGTAKDGYYDDQEDGVTAGRKRALFGVSDSDEDADDGSHLFSSEHTPHVPVTQIESREDDDDDDDRIPICQVFKKMRKERVSDDGELDETKGCSTPTTRRSARLAKHQSKGGRAARRALNFVEPKEYEGSEDDMDEGSEDVMDDFINDDDSSESASDSAGESCAEQEVSGASAPNEESSPEPEDSDSEIDYADVIACIGRKRKTKDWEHEGQMLAAFDKYPELCLKAVCALYRKQTKDEQLEKATLFHNKQGFNQIDALRGSHIAEFLLDGDPNGPLKKTVAELKEYDRYALEFCHKVATRYSKQLFAIYQNKEDPYFLP